jgi:acyl dehydratase
VTSTITDEALDVMRSELHRSWRVRGWNSTATADAMWHFAMGVGDDNPLWWDADYAKKTSEGRMFGSPTFLYSCQGGPVIPGLHESVDRGVDTWLPGAVGLWAGDRWVFHGRVFAGEEVETNAELWEVKEREGRFSGRSIYQTTKTTFAAGDGRPLAEQYRTIFRTEPDAATGGGHYAEIPEPLYTAEDRRRFREQYLAEGAHRRGAETLHVEDVSVGDALPLMLKGPLTTTNLVSWILGWGSAYCLPNRLGATFIEERPAAGLVNPRFGCDDTIEGPHWDDSLARTRGLPRGYDFGSQRISWLAHLLTDWYGDDGELAELDVRLRRPNLLGDVQWLSGTVTDVSTEDGGAGRVSVSVESRNQRDEVTATGTAVVLLKSRRQS